jgi:hypothetical protein
VVVLVVVHHWQRAKPQLLRQKRRAPMVGLLLVLVQRVRVFMSVCMCVCVCVCVFV